MCWRATRPGIISRRLIKAMSRGVAYGLLPIALIDFPMPRKTQDGSCRCTGCRLSGQLLFKLLRRTIVQSRVQPGAIIVLLNELLRMVPQILQVLVLVDVNFFHLQSLDPALTGGIVVGIAGAAHAQLN